MTQVKEAKSKLDESTDNLRNYERDHQIVVVNPDHERLMSIDTERLEQLQQEFTQVEDTRMEKEATSSAPGQATRAYCKAACSTIP